MCNSNGTSGKCLCLCVENKFSSGDNVEVVGEWEIGEDNFGSVDFFLKSTEILALQSQTHSY